MRAIVIVLLAACSARGGATITSPPALGEPIDRVGRPLTANMLIGPTASEDDSSRRKEAYNRAARGEWGRFAADIQASLGFYDGFDGTCGNQWMAAGDAAADERYRALADLLADDRLWIDTAATSCTTYLALERGVGGSCGGRPPTIDAIDGFRSLLIDGTTTAITDGVDADDHVHSTSEFPFLAAP